jgi:plastocyanin
MLWNAQTAIVADMPGAWNARTGPFPASVATGSTVAFRNADSMPHHIVQDGGAFDTGNLAPGATSAAITIGSGTALPYHCTIHPSMVGSVNGSSGNSPGGSGY